MCNSGGNCEALISFSNVIFKDHKNCTQFLRFDLDFRAKIRVYGEIKMISLLLLGMPRKHFYVGHIHSDFTQLFWIWHS